MQVRKKKKSLKERLHLFNPKKQLMRQGLFELLEGAMRGCDKRVNRLTSVETTGTAISNTFTSQFVFQVYKTGACISYFSAPVKVTHPRAASVYSSTCATAEHHHGRPHYGRNQEAKSCKKVCLFIGHVSEHKR